jgi:hypothetical protein
MKWLRGWYEVRETKFKADREKINLLRDEAILADDEREREIRTMYRELDKHFFREPGTVQVRPVSAPKAASGESQELLDEAWMRWQRDHPS